MKVWLAWMTFREMEDYELTVGVFTSLDSVKHAVESIAPAPCFWSSGEEVLECEDTQWMLGTRGTGQQMIVDCVWVEELSLDELGNEMPSVIVTQ